MIISCADGSCIGDAGNGNRREINYSSPTVWMMSPALHGSVRKQGTGVILSGTDSDSGRDILNRNRDGTVCGRTVSKLAFIIVPPALHGSVRKQGTGMLFSYADLCYRYIRETGNGNRNRAVCIPELSTQHSTLPSVSRAQVWASPAETLCTVGAGSASAFTMDNAARQNRTMPAVVQNRIARFPKPKTSFFIW